MQKTSPCQTFNIEELIIHHLMLQSVFLRKNGLLYGKSGITIAFFECGRFWNNPVYSDYAKELKDSLPNKIEDNLPLDFATGLCGFGWGIEYMIQNHFIESNSAEICEGIDQRIMTLNMRRITDISLESGLEGFLHYILIRLKGEIMRKTHLLFDETYLKDTYDRLLSFPERTIKQNFVTFMETGLLTYQPDISLFTNDLEIKNEDDILSAKLGLADGLAGILVRKATNKKTFRS